MSGISSLTANLLPVEFAFDSLEVWSSPLLEDDDLAAIRESSRGISHVQWDGGQLYTLPLAADAPMPADAKLVELRVVESLRFLARLVTDALVRRFPTYEPIRSKPFTFLGHKMELMRDAAKALGLEQPLLSEFRIWPKYSLDGRIMELRSGSPFIAVAVDVATRWEIKADVEALTEAGVNLGGLYVVRRQPDPDQRRLAGRVASISAGRVELSESTDGATSIDAGKVMLEGRKDAFARCLKPLLGASYARYDSYRDKRMGELLGGRPLLEEIRRVSTILAERPLELAHGLACSVGEPLRVTNSPNYKSVVVARQLDYCFDPARSKRHRYAWPGLDAYGPFSRDTFARPSPRILVVHPLAAKGAVENFVRLLRDGIPSQRGFRAGMVKTFGLRAHAEIG
ncbi:MAG: hypothetical protein ACR2JU_03230 [Nocardioidaceae bacterium]